MRANDITRHEEDAVNVGEFFVLNFSLKNLGRVVNSRCILRMWPFALQPVFLHLSLSFLEGREEEEAVAEDSSWKKVSMGDCRVHCLWNMHNI